MKKIELLSPVGGYTQFIAAVESGADAVYLGGSSFNARNSATNFSDDELKEAIKYAHIRGVKVHLTLNILMHDYEINEAIEFAKRAYSYGVDAFIVQDLGVIKLLNEVIPGANIHFSTQGTVYSLDGVKALIPFNFERIVLARELTLDEIENICKNTDKEIEVFVHGALCICYSGQCRYSSLIGERSGNRGKCAQPCRLKYSLYMDDEKKKSEYILSPKDLCGIYDLIRLIKAGVTSLKIEGRLKSPEYVACVTSIYRKYIDLAYELIEKGDEDKYKVDEEDIKKLLQVFNRGGFSRGYYYGESSRELMCYERPKHWGVYLGKVLNYDKRRKLVTVKLEDNLNMGDGVEIVNDSLPGNVVTYIEKDRKQVKSAIKGDIVVIGDITGEIGQNEDIYKITDKELNSSLKLFTNGKFYRKVPVNMVLVAKVGENVRLQVRDNDGNFVEFISDYISQKALNRPIDLDNAYSGLAKLGDTSFKLEELVLDSDKDALVPASILNDIRRQAIDLLIKERAIINRSFPSKEVEKVEVTNKEREGKISVYLYNVKNLEGLELADRVYVPIANFDMVKEVLKDKEVVPYLTATERANKVLGTDSFVSKLDSVLVGNWEHLEFFKDVENKYCDASFNIFNSYTCEALEEVYKVRGVNFSYELNLEEIKKIDTNLEVEVTVYGRLPLMISEHCVIGSEMAGNKNCNFCEKAQFWLEDRIGEKFPIITDRKSCRMQILNSKVLYAGEVIKELKGRCDYFRAYFFDEATEERRRILSALKKVEELRGFTSGHFYRGV